VDEDGDMVLWFVQNNPALQPNHNALQFHKTACLIWRMAGGAESEDEECSDDDDGDSIYVADNEMSLQEKIPFLFSRQSSETTLENSNYELPGKGELYVKEADMKHLYK
jgi:hypothetical protein